MGPINPKDQTQGNAFIDEKTVFEFFTESCSGIILLFAAIESLVNNLIENAPAYNYYKKIKINLFSIGKYLIVVRAYDMAGNWQEGNVKIEILPEGLFLSTRGIHYQQFVLAWWLLALILILITLFVLFSLRWKYRKFARKRESELERKIEEISEIKKDRLEETFAQITKKEDEIEKEKREIEEKEKAAKSLEEKQEIEKMRWEIKDRRKEIEKERWKIEEEKRKSNG